MKALIQRVSQASIVIDGVQGGSIAKGLVVFVGIKKGDSSDHAQWLAEKILNLRIFPNESGKFDFSINETKGELLIVSQFTLYGDCQQGRRPDFTQAEEPIAAEALYDKFVEEISKSSLKVVTGKFASDMQVEIHNDGPVTLIVEKGH